MAIMVAVASLAPLLVPLLMNSLLSSYFCLLTPCAGDDRFSRTSSGGRRRIDQQPVPVAWPCVALIKLNPSGSLAWPQIDQCQYHEKVKYMGSFSAQTKMSKQQTTGRNALRRQSAPFAAAPGPFVRGHQHFASCGRPPN